MKRIYLFTILMISLISACNPKFYTPNTQNVPLLSTKGEMNLTLSGNGNQVEFQGANAITNNIGIKANGGLFIPPDLDNGNGGSGKFLEAGIGYYKELSPGWVFETYGIAGFGSFENHLPASATTTLLTMGDISANIFRIGLQPNIGYKSKFFSAALSTRIANLSYNNIEGDLIFDGEDQVEYLEENKSNILIEPALTIRGGLEKLKLQLQYGYSFNASNSNFSQDKAYLTLGLNFNFK